MSGVYIKGMGMPKNCAECPVNMNICHHDYKYLLEHMDLYDRRAEDCPIIPITDHGNLIDRDKFMGTMLPNNRVYQGDVRISYPPTVWQILDSISKAPTIIPADFAKDTNVPTKTADKEVGE